MRFIYIEFFENMVSASATATKQNIIKEFQNFLPIVDTSFIFPLLLTHSIKLPKHTDQHIINFLYLHNCLGDRMINKKNVGPFLYSSTFNSYICSLLIQNTYKKLGVEYNTTESTHWWMFYGCFQFFHVFKMHEWKMVLCEYIYSFDFQCVKITTKLQAF